VGSPEIPEKTPNNIVAGIDLVQQKKIRAVMSSKT